METSEKSVPESPLESELTFKEAEYQVGMIPVVKYQCPECQGVTVNVSNSALQAAQARMDIKDKCHRCNIPLLAKPKLIVQPKIELARR